MRRRPPLAVALFAAFTVLIWGQRIVNIAGPAGGSAFDLARAVAFVIAGLAVAFAAARTSVGAAHLERVVGVAAALTVVSWLVQMVLIVGRDRSIGFVVVHAVLAVVSIGLAAWAWSVVRRSTGSTGTGTAPAADRSPADVGV